MVSYLSLLEFILLLKFCILVYNAERGERGMGGADSSNVRNKDIFMKTVAEGD